MKFQFTEEYQRDLLAYTVQNSNGYQALKLYKPDYFTLLTHSTIAYALNKFYKKNHKVPGLTMLKEELIFVFKERDFAQSLLPDDRKEILNIANSLYDKPVKDSDDIFRGCARWASYVELRGIFEKTNLIDFNTHDALVNNIVKAVNIRNVSEKKQGTFLIRDVVERQYERQANPSIIPTPFRQVNRCTNAGGYSKGSIIVLLDKPKSLKTFTLINIAMSYAKMKKNVFIADLENGEGELSIRAEQSIMNLTKKEITSGESDRDVQKTLRRYNRMGIEIYIRRFPSGTTVREIGAEMAEIRRVTGLQFKVLVADYAALMGPSVPSKDETSAISQVYLDLANLALLEDLDAIYTANHVKREAEKRRATRYNDTDIAKCMDIIRHVQAIWGLNMNEEEQDNGILRWELVSQRDGIPSARAMFHMDPTTQRMKELTNAEVANYKHYSPKEEGLEEGLKSGKFRGDYE